MSEVEVTGKRKIGKASVDRISNLPSNIIEHILECLPLQFAVRTSILSKCWRYKWCHLHQLILDEQFFLNVRKALIKKDSDYLPACSKIVDSILLRHFGHIHKFVLHSPYGLTIDADVSHWIKLICSNVLKDLTLTNCVCLPLTSTGFQNLVSLQLYMCRIPDYIVAQLAQKLEVLISSCPQLECLDLTFFHSFEASGSLTIHAPKLQHLRLQSSFSKVCLDRTTMVRSLHLNRPWQQENSCLPELEKLIINVYCVSDCLVLGGDGPAEKLAFPKLGKLRNLELSGIQMNSHKAVSLVLHLLMSSPHLEKLKFYVEYSEANNDIFLKETGSLQSLKNVELHINMNFIYGQMPSVEEKGALPLVKFLLACSPVLETMIVNLERDLRLIDIQEKLDVAKEMLRHHRASPNAEIILTV